MACVQNIKNPVKVSRALLEQGRHSFLVGSAADDYGKSMGEEMVSNDYFTTTTRKAHWEGLMRKAPVPFDDLGTVGAVALDVHGNLAAAGSTGGMTGKMSGRIGDTAVAGAGLYADKNVAVAW